MYYDDVVFRSYVDGYVVMDLTTEHTTTSYIYISFRSCVTEGLCIWVSFQNLTRVSIAVHAGALFIRPVLSYFELNGDGSTKDKSGHSGPVVPGPCRSVRRRSLELWRHTFGVPVIWDPFILDRCGQHHIVIYAAHDGVIAPTALVS